MKKFMKTLGIVVGLPLLYFSITNILIYIVGRLYIMNNRTTASRESLIKFINSNSLIISLVTGLIILALLLLFIKKKVVPPCKLNKISFKTILYIAIFCFGTAVIMGILVGLLTLIFPSYKEISNLMQESHTSIFKLFVIVVFAPIFEEIFFRGVIFGYLKKNYNIVLAIILQALVFGILHGNIVQGIYAFILGVILALIYYYTNSLYSSIVFHLIFNLLGGVVIPILYIKFPFIIFIFIPLAIACLVFTIIKAVNKYGGSLYEKY